LEWGDCVFIYESTQETRWLWLLVVVSVYSWKQSIFGVTNAMNEWMPKRNETNRNHPKKGIGKQAASNQELDLLPWKKK
jgi:hypothetical protein